MNRGQRAALAFLVVGESVMLAFGLADPLQPVLDHAQVAQHQFGSNRVELARRRLAVQGPGHRQAAERADQRENCV